MWDILVILILFTGIFVPSLYLGYRIGFNKGWNKCMKENCDGLALNEEEDPDWLNDPNWWKKGKSHNND